MSWLHDTYTIILVIRPCDGEISHDNKQRLHHCGFTNETSEAWSVTNDKIKESLLFFLFHNYFHI